MKVKYRISDNTCVAMGTDVGIPKASEAVADIPDTKIPDKRIDFYKFINNTIVEKVSSDQQNILDTEKRFNRQDFITWVNTGVTLQDKFDKLVKTVSLMAEHLQEQNVKNI